jgi:[glutamine synthetase] adenylyltransferase / [glutamine synthetase]-adenylyl-L-tyrosine phosphorylase
MTESVFNPETNMALDQAWDRERAAANMDRWLSVCSKEGWGRYPENITLLAKVFGASWYFTRFIFFRGRDVARYIDKPVPDNFSPDQLKKDLLLFADATDLEERMENLRIGKNEFMFRILLAWLTGRFNQEQSELAITHLAEATLRASMQILAQEYKYSDDEIVILGMGRMAGYEMDFGSDLDLIFLYPGNEHGAPPAMIKLIQSLLRHIALPSPNGILYEIDMRLRPHGTSGTLISPAPYFIEYHSDKREVWERQMMTRCRPVIDSSDALGARSLAEISSAIYQQYDGGHLATEIIRMRMRVEKELGSPKGRHEIKRGPGGIMDIDFITHYLQLLHGHEHNALRTPSTRNALRKLAEAGIISDSQCTDLLTAYDFLKRIESSLRIMDLKNVSAFSREREDIQPLARAMDYTDNDQAGKTAEFLADYEKITGQVRSHFNDLVGKTD